MEATVGIEPPSRRSARLSDLLDEGYRLTRAIFHRIAIFAVLTAVPGLAALLIGYASLENAPAVDIDIVRFFWTVSASIVGFMLAQAVLEPLVMAVIYMVVTRECREQTWTLGSVIAGTFRRFGAVLTVAVLYFGAMYGLAAVALAGWVALLGGGYLAVSSDIGLGAMVILLGLVMIPAGMLGQLWFAVRYGFSIPVVVAEPQRAPLSSFARSAQLVRGAYMQAFLLILALAAIRFGLGMILNAFTPQPNLHSGRPDDIIEMVPGVVRTMLLQQVFGTLIGTVFSIYAGACWMALYFRRADQHRGTSAAPAVS